MPPSKPQGPPPPHPAAQPQPADGVDATLPAGLPARVQAALRGQAPHVRTALLRILAPAAHRAAAPAPGSEYVLFEEKKLGDAPPPPAKRPVYVLQVGHRGRGCTLRDVHTGQVRAAGTLYAAFVRMRKDGPLYVSPRAGVGIPGDSHATLASHAPEWAAGQRAIVAGGELGLIDGEVVGYNDKTGHFQTRRNRQQAGLPPDRFYPFTVDPRTWFKK